MIRRQAISSWNRLHIQVQVQVQVKVPNLCYRSMSNNIPSIAPIIGPDLNSSRPALDKKLYRQILLPNGLRCCLIQDVFAVVDAVVYDDDDESSSHKTQGSAGTNDDSTSGGDDTGMRDAAASLVVGAGSMYDPVECQGLAHFLEHLLFMGSEKYPSENEYDNFVSKRGGSDNAWTGSFQYVSAI
jgi:nardilysin